MREYEQDECLLLYLISKRSRRPRHQTPCHRKSIPHPESADPREKGMVLSLLISRDACVIFPYVHDIQMLIVANVVLNIHITVLSII